MSINLLPWREIKAKRTIKIYQYALVISLITLLTASLAIRALIQYKASLKLVDNKQITHLIALNKKNDSRQKRCQSKSDAITSPHCSFSKNASSISNVPAKKCHIILDYTQQPNFNNQWLQYEY